MYLAQHELESDRYCLDTVHFYEVAEGSDGVVSVLTAWFAMLQLQQACLLAELLLAVMLQHLAESDGDPSALSRLGDNRVSLHVPCMQVCACFL